MSRAGIAGIPMKDAPKGYLALLRKYRGVYDLVAETAIHKRKDLAIQALLANPVTHKVSRPQGDARSHDRPAASLGRMIGDSRGSSERSERWRSELK